MYFLSYEPTTLAYHLLNVKSRPGGVELNYLNAVFEGGGVKAIALVGAVKATEERGFHFSRMAGTSSGAMIASFLAAGYTADEMKFMILRKPFTEFLPNSLLHRFNMVGTTIRFYVKQGLYSGDALEEWVHQQLLKKGLRTFGDLERNKLRIIASDITRGKLLVLPDDIAYYGQDPKKLEIARAVRMSTSIPFFFDPVIVTSRTRIKKSYYIVDGGILSNFPLWLFDKETKRLPISALKKVTPVIGYQLVGKNENQPKNITGPLTMVKAVISTMMGAHDERYLEDHSRFRTIKIPALGVSTTQFDLSNEKRMQLYRSGLAAGRKFFNSWNFNDYVSKLQQLRKQY